MVFDFPWHSYVKKKLKNTFSKVVKRALIVMGPFFNLRNIFSKRAKSNFSFKYSRMSKQRLTTKMQVRCTYF